MSNKIICDKNSVYRIYFARCMAQLVKYDVHTTRKINSIHAIFYHILSLYCIILYLLYFTLYYTALHDLLLYY